MTQNIGRGLRKTDVTVDTYPIAGTLGKLHITKAIYDLYGDALRCSGYKTVIVPDVEDDVEGHLSISKVTGHEVISTWSNTGSHGNAMKATDLATSFTRALQMGAIATGRAYYFNVGLCIKMSNGVSVVSLHRPVTHPRVKVLNWSTLPNESAEIDGFRWDEQMCKTLQKIRCSLKVIPTATTESGTVSVEIRQIEEGEESGDDALNHAV